MGFTTWSWCLCLACGLDSALRSSGLGSGFRSSGLVFRSQGLIQVLGVSDHGSEVFQVKVESLVLLSGGPGLGSGLGVLVLGPRSWPLAVLWEVMQDPASRSQHGHRKH